MLTYPESLNVDAVGGFDGRLGVLFILELNEAVALVERHAQHLSVGLKHLHYVLPGQLVRGEVADENARVHHHRVVAARVATLAVVDLLKTRSFSRHAAFQKSAKHMRARTRGGNTRRACAKGEKQKAT